MRIDPFFDKQPNINFTDLLNRPVHECAPKHFGKAEAEAGEISALGAYIAQCHPEWHDTIQTAITDYEDFLRITGVYGDRYPIRVVCAEGYSEESYKILADADKCTVYASDPEGA